MKIGEWDNDNSEWVGLLEAGKTIDVHYYDKINYYDKFTQVDNEINSFHQYTDTNNDKQKSVKGIRVEDYHVDTDDSTTNHDTLDGDEITVYIADSPRFKAYFVMADGSERALTSEELAKLVISYTYVENSGDDEHFGHQTAPAVNDFSYNETNDVIMVANYTTYKNGVYTLKATYDGKFSDDFDIVFERAS